MNNMSSSVSTVNTPAVNTPTGNNTATRPADNTLPTQTNLQPAQIDPLLARENDPQLPETVEEGDPQSQANSGEQSDDEGSHYQANSGEQSDEFDDEDIDDVKIAVLMNELYTDFQSVCPLFENLKTQGNEKLVGELFDAISAQNKRRCELIEQFHTDMTTAKSARDNAGGQLRTIHQRLNEMKLAYEKAEESCKTYKEQDDQRKETLQSISSECDTLHEKCNNLQQICISQDGKIKELTQECERLKQEKADLNQECERLKKEKADLTQEVKKLEKFKLDQADVTIDLQKRNSILVKECAGLRYAVREVTRICTPHGLRTSILREPEQEPEQELEQEPQQTISAYATPGSNVELRALDTRVQEHGNLISEQEETIRRLQEDVKEMRENMRKLMQDEKRRGKQPQKTQRKPSSDSDEDYDTKLQDGMSDDALNAVLHGTTSTGMSYPPNMPYQSDDAALLTKAFQSNSYSSTQTNSTPQGLFTATGFGLSFLEQTPARQDTRTSSQSYPSQQTPARQDTRTTSYPSQQTPARQDTRTTSYPSQDTRTRQDTRTSSYPSQQTPDTRTSSQQTPARQATRTSSQNTPATRTSSQNTPDTRTTSNSKTFRSQDDHATLNRIWKSYVDAQSNKYILMSKYNTWSRDETVFALKDNGFTMID